MKAAPGSKHENFQCEGHADFPINAKQIHYFIKYVTAKAINDRSSDRENSIKSGSFYFDKYSSSSCVQF